MKFQPDTFLGTNAVTRHEAGAVWVNCERFEGSVLVRDGISAVGEATMPKFEGDKV